MIIDRWLWRLWLMPRPLSWDFRVPQPVWNWWTERLVASVSRPDIERLIAEGGRQ